MSDPNTHQQLQRARVELLDLTARNRLINTARSSSRSSRLEIVDELSDDVFQRLVVDGKSMTFLPRQEPSDESRANQDAGGSAVDGLGQPSESELPPGAGDNRLQTELESEKLQSRLLKLYYDARTYEQEHGANVLYLAAGFLKWFESPSSEKPRYAPLILIPVTLKRTHANSRFRLSANDNDLSTNLSLREKLKLEFEIELPEIPESQTEPETFRPSDYFEAVRRAIGSQSNWEVLDNDIVLWLYSFTRFLMYQDLLAESWPENQRIHAHPLVRALLGEGFDGGQLIFDEEDSVDRIISPHEMFHVMDADSSQMLVIEESKCGTNLVVQGPPGTGKSQTITNMIATAVQAGKRVLFVAEKMAALEVVKRRLENIELGDMCLELHSHKANKRDVLQDLDKTLQLKPPRKVNVSGRADELATFRRRMNKHAVSLHAPIGASGRTAFDVIGQLVRLAAAKVPPAEFSLPHAPAWSQAEMRQHQQRLQDLLPTLRQVGIPCQHPWRGVGIASVLPTDLIQIQRGAASTQSEIRELIDRAEELGRHLPCLDDSSCEGTQRLVDLAKRALAKPQGDASGLTSQAWQPEHRRDLREMVFETGPAVTRSRKEWSGQVTDEAWTTDFTATRRHLAVHGRSLWRLFRRDYREAFASLAAILVQRPPRSLNERLKLIDGLMAAQRAEQLMNDSDLLPQAFGEEYRQHETDWETLQAMLNWVESCEAADVPPSFFKVCTGSLDRHSVTECCNAVEDQVPTVRSSLADIGRRLKLNTETAFGVREPESVPLQDWAVRFQQWLDSPDELQHWVGFYQRFQDVVAADLLELADEIHAGRIDADSVIDQYETAYYEALLKKAYQEYPALAEFEGASHEYALKRFVELDQGRIEDAREQVAASHRSSLPVTKKSPGMKVLRHEMKKKMRHISLRKLLSVAGPEIQAIKPVFMMSPMSVAQYLPPGAVDFDLLLIDEASQVRPCDAIGVIARAKQIVVVGDERQLPPTTFFDKVTNESGDPDESFQSAADLESVLGLCESQNLPRRMLRWHYRSQHQSLIAVSNKTFYDNQLLVVPSPHASTEQLGLKFRFVTDGIYDRGGTSSNRNEARAVALAVMQHAREHARVSLGVGAFSVSQRDAILEELEILRRSDPETEHFFVDEGAEPFFVKNLENIQGDERDCIFISVGYGRDSGGKLSMSFGPLNLDGGQRRLNVLITRAKQRCEVFSSIHADEIDLSRSQAQGVAALKTFLRYAEHGVLDADEKIRRAPDSEFERQVAVALEQHGFEVHAQVGMEGFVVDLAIVDPTTPGRYRIGIECDGTSYCSATSARDRDRIRQQVLEDRGWIIHRIWCIDWFRNPDEQLQNLLSAIRR